MPKSYLSLKLLFPVGFLFTSYISFPQSNFSDVTDNTNYSSVSPEFNSNTAYINFIDATSTTTGKIVAMKFRITDGGSANANDADNLPTILTGISFSVTDYLGTNKIALIKTAILTTSGASVISTASKSGGQLVFSGMSGTAVTAADNDNKIIHLRLSFDETQVTDNTKLIFTVVSVTASATGSNFAAFNGGGASTDNSNSNDRNRIEIIADRLRFAQQPTNTFINTNMAPSPTVQMVDAFNHVDLDITGTVSVTSTGNLSSSPQTAVASVGFATLNYINHLTTGTGLKLTAASGILASATSNTFNITAAFYQAGDYRPSSSNIDFATNNAWESFDGSIWTTGATPPQDLPPASKPSRIIIDKTNISGGNNSTNQYKNIIVTNGGELVLSDNTSPTIDFISSGNRLEVLNGGKLVVNGQININSSADFIARGGGSVILNNGSVANNHGIWAGNENFEPASFFKITAWNWSAPKSNSSIINATTDNITNNNQGYKFGVLTVNASPSVRWSLISGGNVNFCDTLNVINSSSFPVLITCNTSSPSITLKTVNHSSGIFALAGSFSGSATQTLNILDDLNSTGGTLKLFHNEGGTAAASSIVNVNLNGNLTIGTSSYGFINDSVPSAKLNFTNSSIQNIDAAQSITAISMNVKSGAIVTLKNHDLLLSSLPGLTVAFSVETGGTLDFGFAVNDFTALVIKKGATGGTNKFQSHTGSTLKITSPNGLQSELASAGNVQFSKSNKNFNQLATFWYRGRNDQITGDGLDTTSSGKVIIVELKDLATRLILSNKTGITNNTSVDAAGGKLDIRQGTLISTASTPITSTGSLIMSGGVYKIEEITTTPVPQLSGAFILSGGTIELNGAGNQILRGARDYQNLTFSNSGTKTLSSPPSSVTGTVTIANSAILTLPPEKWVAAKQTLQ